MPYWPCLRRPEVIRDGALAGHPRPFRRRIVPWGSDVDQLTWR